MTFNTGNPVGSVDPRDLYDNAKNADIAVNTQDPTWTDRLGVERKSWAGIEQGVSDALSRLGYQVKGDYAADLLIENYSEVFRKDGEFYRAKSELELPYPLNGDWAVDAPKFVSVGDAVLRQDLAAPEGSELIGAGVRSQSSKNSDVLSIKDSLVTPVDGITDNTAGIGAAALDALAKAKRLFVTAGRYVVSALVLNDSQAFGLRGEGRGRTVFSRLPGSTASMLNFRGHASLELQGITVEKNTTDSLDKGHGVVLIDQSDARVKEVDIRSFGGEGSGVIAYPTGSEKPRNIVFDDITVIGDRDISSNTNGVLITNSEFSRMSGIYAKGIEAFAVEYKSLAQHSLISDVLVDDAVHGIGYGQTTEGQFDGVRLCAATNAVLKGCTTAIVTGKGGFNVFSNMVIDATDSRSEVPRAIRSSLNSFGNAYNGILLYGPFTEPVRWGSNRNYASVFAHNSNNNIVTIEAGMERNVTDIQHPGTRLSIRDAITDSSGNPLSGAAGNPAYCLATGEFLGSLSERWLFTHSKVPSVSLLSAHRLAIEAAGSTFFAVASDGSASCGFAVAFPTVTAQCSYSPGGYWQMVGSNWNARFSASYWQPSTDNVVSLGGAANRFSTVHAGTGSIITSDERSKQQIKPIDEAALRAWARVEYVQYKFNDAVEEKGHGARWHFGLIAQRVKEAFEAEGLNAFDYGLLCYDEWDETPAVEEEPYRPAGNRYGIRYEEALALECAYLRSKIAA